LTPLQEGLLTALGIGLLIGLMRERRSDDPDSGPSAAGLRTHALAALGAALAWHLGPNVFLVTLAISGLLVTVSYKRSAKHDIGLTGEFALLVTVLLGALAMISVGMSAAMGVVCALLLHLRSQLHHLGRELISEQEVHDGLVLAASALVVLPLLPDEPIDPWGVIVPSSLWNLVVLVMAAGVAGQVALRLVGARFGLPVAGFFSGFASSTAATVGYGQRVVDESKLLPYAASAALFANLASLLLLCGVLSTINVDLLKAATWPLAAAGLALAACASLGMFRSGSRESYTPTAAHSKSFKLSHALALIAFVAVLLVLSAILSEKFGERGALAVAVIGGMAELHGAALTIGQLARGGQIPVEHASWGIVFLLLSSSAVKSVLAFGSGGRAYGIRVCGGLAIMVTAAVLASWFMQ
jgi:uncharacterized membrane protein (DUF4010 family)